MKGENDQLRLIRVSKWRKRAALIHSGCFGTKTTLRQGRLFAMECLHLHYPNILVTDDVWIVAATILVFSS